MNVVLESHYDEILFVPYYLQGEEDGAPYVYGTLAAVRKHNVVVSKKVTHPVDFGVYALLITHKSKEPLSMMFDGIMVDIRGVNYYDTEKDILSLEFDIGPFLDTYEIDEEPQPLYTGGNYPKWHQKYLLSEARYHNYSKVADFLAEIDKLGEVSNFNYNYPAVQKSLELLGFTVDKAVYEWPPTIDAYRISREEFEEKALAFEAEAEKAVDTILEHLEESPQEKDSRPWWKRVC